MESVESGENLCYTLEKKIVKSAGKGHSRNNFKLLLMTAGTAFSSFTGCTALRPDPPAGRAALLSVRQEKPKHQKMTKESSL